jgi:hypothetical protein
MLPKQVEAFESIIKELEYIYQQELLTLELGLSSQTDRVEASMQCINSYLHHWTERIMRTIRYKETLLRMKLKHLRHRSSTSSACTATSVYPEAIVATSCSVFSNEELHFLSSTGHIQLFFLAVTVFMRLLRYLFCLSGGPNYIRKNQSSLYHEKRIQRSTQLELPKMIAKLGPDLSRRHGMVCRPHRKI